MVVEPTAAAESTAGAAVLVEEVAAEAGVGPGVLVGTTNSLLVGVVNKGWLMGGGRGEWKAGRLVSKGSGGVSGG